jgi:quinol monooxygenase YgiN
MSAPFALPKQTSGKIILLVRQQLSFGMLTKLTFSRQAQVTAKPGKADEVQKLLVACRAAAESEEKNTLTYRTTRDGDKFAIWEEYVLPDGLVDHGMLAIHYPLLSPC